MDQSINTINIVTFWWSVVSTILSFLLVCFSIWQYKDGKNKEEKSKAQVKVWMQDANGISNGMNRIISDNLEKRYSTTNDVCNTIFTLQSCAFALYQSLYEERCITEEEYKAKQKKIEEMINAKQTTQIKETVENKVTK